MPHDLQVATKHCPRGFDGEHYRQPQVDDEADGDRGHGASRNASPRIAEIPGHADSGRDSSYCGEEHGKDSGEAHPASQRSIRGQQGDIVPRAVSRCAEAHQAEPNEQHDDILSLDGDVGAPQAEGRERHTDHARDDAGREARGHRDEGLSEPHYVEREREGLRQEKRHADSAAYFGAEAAGEHEVSTARANRSVRRDGADAQAGDNRSGVGDEHDRQGTEESRMADHPPQAQVHDDPEDGQHAGREHPGKGAELAVG
jgi:hypothetical protein